MPAVKVPAALKCCALAILLLILLPFPALSISISQIRGCGVGTMCYRTCFGFPSLFYCALDPANKFILHLRTFICSQHFFFSILCICSGSFTLCRSCSEPSSSLLSSQWPEGLRNVAAGGGAGAGVLISSTVEIRGKQMSAGG